MIAADAAPERAKTRLDQWLWFARLVKSRSLAARLCTSGAVTLNGNNTLKANQAVRGGDILVIAHGGWQRTLRIVAIGVRRGPATEARTLYEETLAPVRLSRATADWVPLLGDDGLEPAAVDGG